MTQTGPIQPNQTLPNQALLQPGDRQSQAIFFLRAAPPAMGAPGRMGNLSLGMSCIVVPDYTPLPAARVLAQRLGQAALPLIQLSGLVHARTLGAPTLNPQSRPASLVHARTLGAPSVTVPPVIPPVIPPSPSVAVSTPRNLRSVRRRNETDTD